MSVAGSAGRLNCTVDNGFGTVVANVTTIDVVCVTEDAVVGTVSGMLPNTNLVLTNGPDVISVGANGNFSFPTSVAATTTVVPSIQLQPSGQSCTLSVPSNGVTGNNNMALTVACTGNTAGTYAVGGSVSGLVARTRITLQNGSDTIYSSNGNFSFQSTVMSGGSYHVTAGMPAGQNCTIVNNTGNVSNAAVTSVAVACTPYFRFTNGQAANVVLGQSTFATNTPPTAVSAVSYGNTYGQTYTSPTGAVYIPDGVESRVLVYNALPSAINAPADAVVGQTSLTAWGQATSAAYIYNPQSVTGNGNTFVVVDQGASRVLIYHAPPLGLDNADVVVGQTSFTAAAAACSQNTLSSPRDVSLGVNGLLAIADVSNNRVLVYHTLPTSNGANADVVLGQSDFGTCRVNRTGTGTSTGTVAANTLNGPSGVWTDGNRLAIADTFNNRVLLFDDILNAVNGQNADVVVGEVDMASSSNVGGATGLYSPFTVMSEGSHLIVADSANNRVLMFDGWPASDYPAATTVLGQADFSSTGVGLGASGMFYPAGLSISGTSLIVADYANLRMLIFSSN